MQSGVVNPGLCFLFSSLTYLAFYVLFAASSAIPPISYDGLGHEACGHTEAEGIVPTESEVQYSYFRGVFQ